MQQWQTNILYNHMKDAQMLSALEKARYALEQAMTIMETQELQITDAYDAALEALSEIAEILDEEDS